MALTKNRLYKLVLLACLAGYIWVALNYQEQQQTHYSGIEVCLIKRTTSVPCPSCGATRSVMAFLHGNFTEALYYNPMGYLLIGIMFFAPLLIFYDIITKNDYFYSLYRTIELTLQRKWLAILAILLVLANWVWNINKGL